jgi:hypothetical protein
LVPKLGGGLAQFPSDLDHKTLLGFNAETSLLYPWNWHLVRWVIEILGRSLFATVLMADVVVRLSQSASYQNREPNITMQASM